MNMVPAAEQQQHKKTLHSMLASRLSNLKIPSCSTSSDPDLDFSELFGPAPPTSSTPPTAGGFLGDPPQVIHNRSHSFVGPSPRFTLSKSLPLHQELDSASETDDENEVEEVCDEKSEPIFLDTVSDNGLLKVEDSEEVRRIGTRDFEILRVIGKGAFGKVFQVRMKKGSSNGISDNGGNDDDGDGDGDGDGIFAMKVMRKDTIIKNNHVDYMKGERDILSKVVHPFIVPLRYSFQVLYSKIDLLCKFLFSLKLTWILCIFI